MSSVNLFLYLNEHQSLNIFNIGEVYFHSGDARGVRKSTPLVLQLISDKEKFLMQK